MFISQELREQELQYKDALRGAEKERKSLEKDLTRALKKLQKALKNQGDPAKEARLNRLLQVVAAQVTGFFLISFWFKCFIPFSFI